MNQFLLRYAQVREDFRIPELEGIINLFNIQVSIIENIRSSPFLIVSSQDQDAIKRISSRSVLLKESSKILAQGSSLEDLRAISMKRMTDSHDFDSFSNLSFKFQVDTFGEHISLSDQLNIINSFSFLPLKGMVNLSNPDIIFTIYIDYLHGKCYFGYLISQGQRHLVERFDLKKRSYLGSTSMDAELSLLIANIARVKSGHLVYDPFVGTGSLLYTASFFGAFTIGSDIDGRQIRGNGNFCQNQSLAPCSFDSSLSSSSNPSQSPTSSSINHLDKESKIKDKTATITNVSTNTDQYNVGDKIIDNLIFDITQHPWRMEKSVLSIPSFITIKFNAIITDPPYGIRAGAKRIGRRIDNKDSNEVVDLSFLTSEQRQERYPMTFSYKLKDIVSDLFNFANTFMDSQGMLVFWYPIEREKNYQKFVQEDAFNYKRACIENDGKNLPKDNDRFTLVAAIPQYLRDVDRWLLAFQKKN